MGWDDNGLADRAAGRRTTSASVATLRSPYLAGFVPPAKAGWTKGSSPWPFAGPTSSSCASAWSPRTRRAFEDGLATPRAVGGLAPALHHDRRDGSAGVAARLPAPPGPRRGLPGRGPTLWDVDFRTAVAQAELEDRERPGAYYRLVFARRRRRRRARSTRPGPSCCRPAWRWSSTPTTRATRPGRHHGRHAAVRRRRCRCWPTSWPSRTRAPGSAMVCTFGDITDVMWWRELGLPVRAIVGRDGRLLATAPAGLTTPAAPSTSPNWPGETVRQAQTPGGRAAPRVGRAATASPAPSPTP